MAIQLATGADAFVFQGQNMFIANVVSTADGDVAGSIAHGLGVIPGVVLIQPLAGAAAAFAALPQWGMTAPDATNVNLTKVGTAGTAVNSLMRLLVMRPHSIIR